MSFERTISGVPPDPGPPVNLAGARGADEMTPALRLQILANEHWSLLAARSLAWNESFSRAGMFLSTVSGVIVALALVGQGSGFSETFILFAIVILPIALFVGLTTFIRMAASNYGDALWTVGLNRIRAGYMEMAPDLERFFVTSQYDDLQGIEQSMGVQAGGSRLLQFFAGSPMVVAILDAAIGGALGALIGLQLHTGAPLIILLGVAGFLVTVGAQATYAVRTIGRAMAAHRPLFPRATTDDSVASAEDPGVR